MTLAAWVHNIDPFLVRFTDTFALRWYGMSYLAGFALGYVLLRWMAKRGSARIPVHRVADSIFIIALGVIVGGRLGYAVFYRPDLFWSFSRSLPWWDLLDLSEGGMASHGGMIGIGIAAWLVSRGFKDDTGVRRGRTPVLHVLDLLCLLGPIGLFFGRIANFINGELLGRIVAGPGESGPWWAVRFPQEIVAAPDGRLYTDHLTPELRSRLVQDIQPLMLPGDTLARGYARMVEAVQAGSAEKAEQLSRYLTARHPSQLYQALAEGIVVGLVVWWVGRRPRRPGVVGGWFLISYGLLRILTEIWRLPDAHFDIGRPGGLSRGQWLSALMVLAGLTLLAIIQRRVSPKLGGWLVRSPAQPSDEQRDQEPAAHESQ